MRNIVYIVLNYNQSNIVMYGMTRTSYSTSIAKNEHFFQIDLKYDIRNLHLQTHINIEN